MSTAISGEAALNTFECYIRRRASSLAAVFQSPSMFVCFVEATRFTLDSVHYVRVSQSASGWHFLARQLSAQTVDLSGCHFLSLGQFMLASIEVVGSQCVGCVGQPRKGTGKPDWEAASCPSHS